VTDRYTYGPYGELEKHEGKTNQPFGYNGRDGVQSDPNGLYYMRARYYHPVLQRFLNRDILRGDLMDGQTLNRYAYVNGDPIRYIDPLGLMKGLCGDKISDRDSKNGSLKLDLQLFADNKGTGKVDSPFVPDEYWGRKAPDFNTPGLKYDHYREYNGKIERSTVIYDNAGRQSYRVDHADHSMPKHSVPHLHERKFGPGYSDKGKEYDYHFWNDER